MSEYPNLKGVATKNLVEKVDAGKYRADYINWSRTMQLLRDNAPGWLPELVPNIDGSFVHRGGVGGYLLIRFVHLDGSFTPGFPQAIMNNRNDSIPLDAITSRDITDTHRRGICMAAALAFGLGYELWAKMPLESGYDGPNGTTTAAPDESTVAPDKQADGIRVPTTWAKYTECISLWDEPTHDLFVAFGQSAARALFGPTVDTKKLAASDKKFLLQKCAGAWLHVREEFDPNEIPYPGLEDIRAGFARVMDGLELAIPDEEMDAEAAEAAEREA